MAGRREAWRQVSRMEARGSIQPKMSAASAAIKLTVKCGVLGPSARDRWSFNRGGLAPYGHTSAWRRNATLSAEFALGTSKHR